MTTPPPKEPLPPLPNPWRTQPRRTSCTEIGCSLLILLTVVILSGFLWIALIDTAFRYWGLR